LNNTSISQIYIGYEEREHDAFVVCKESIEQARLSGYDIDIIKLRSQDIPEYKRDWGEPQSTDFTFTRFWAPYLSKWKGWSIYCDCDFLFLENVDRLRQYMDPKYAICVVKHPPYIPHSQKKMDNIDQHRSYRKNWASFMLFNNEHLSNKILFC